MMLIAQLAFAAAILPAQDKPDQSGLPLLNKIMQILQESETCHISGSKFIETAPSQLEYDGDIQIYRQKKNLRYSYASFWGDTTTTIINPKYMSLSTDGESYVSEAPKSWAIRSEKQSAGAYGGLIISLLAPPQDIPKFIDLTKPVTLQSNSGWDEVNFTFITGTKHQVRLLNNQTIEIRTPNPGFPGFSDPTNDLEVFRIASKNKSVPTWYFEIKK
jgi:hypothetical protein